MHIYSIHGTKAVFTGSKALMNITYIIWAGPKTGLFCAYRNFQLVIVTMTPTSVGVPSSQWDHPSSRASIIGNGNLIVLFSINDGCETHKRRHGLIKSSYKHDHIHHGAIMSSTITQLPDWPLPRGQLPTVFCVLHAWLGKLPNEYIMASSKGGGAGFLFWRHARVHRPDQQMGLDRPHQWSLFHFVTYARL